MTRTCIVQKNPHVPNTARQVASYLVNTSRGKLSSMPHPKTRPDSPVTTLQGPCDPSLKWIGTLRFLPQLEMWPSSNAPNPVESREAPPSSTVSLTSQRHHESSLRSPAQVEGTEGFLPQPVKDLESPSSTRLEARFPYHDSRAMTRSPSPLAWRPDFPGTPLQYSCLENLMDGRAW